MRNWNRLLLLLFFCLAFPGLSFAEIKFTPGASLRLRHEFLKNIYDLNNSAKDNQNYFRIRYSLWANTEFNKDTSLYVKLTDESKAYTYWLQASGKKGYHYDINETVIDNLYLELKNVAGAPVDLRAGRQDLIGLYGENFLIADGTPLDGSRTYYFNAFKSSWRADDKNTVDFVYVNDPRDEGMLPVINRKSPPRALNTADEEGYMLYWKNKNADKLALEPFYIYKKEGAGGTRLESQKGRINTPGVYAKYDLMPYTLRGQLAYETGNYGADPRRAIGGYFFVDRGFKEKIWQPKLTAGYIYLSGDDPSTAKNEGWDPLFSRYPWMSEICSASYNSESGLAYWTNLQMWQLKGEINPTKKFKMEAAYNFLRANEIPTGTTFAVGDGKNRGQLPQFKATYTFNKNVSTYFLAEYLIPGNFYADTADPALFLRTELMIKF